MNRVGLLLVCAVLVLGLAACASQNVIDGAAAPYRMVDGRRQYQLPRLEGTVTIDGVVELAEWKDALRISATHVDFVQEGIGSSIWNINMGADAEPQVPRAEGTIAAFWSDEGLYLSAVITDPNRTHFQPYGGQSNIQDAVQFTFDPDFQRGSATLQDVYIIDLSMSEQGETYWYEYFQYGGYDATAGIETAGGPTETGWAIEAFIPWSALRAAGEQFVPASGVEMGFGILMCDFADPATLNDLYWDFGEMENTIDQPGTWNSIVLR